VSFWRRGSGDRSSETDPLTSRPPEVDWLVQEVLDLLDVSSVGLYEFHWIIRSSEPDMEFEGAEALSVRALDILLRNSAGKLVWLTWPDSEHFEATDLSAFDLPPGAWDDPSPRYLALDRR
jgi:hypothetical protein